MVQLNDLAHLLSQDADHMDDFNCQKHANLWINYIFRSSIKGGARWLSGRMLDSRSRGCEFESYWKYCIVSLSKIDTFSSA